MPSLFTLPSDPSLLSYGVYTPALVVLSVLVAIFASWMGLLVAGQAVANRGQRWIVLGTGSLALGTGVWAMHFIGMLAFDLCTDVDYDPAITILSGVPSIAASFVALNLIARERLGAWTMLLGGTLVGAGIGAMHYAGMEGMRMDLELRYDPLMFGLSIVVAVVLATLALWVRFGLSNLRRLGHHWRLLLAGIVMGCAIAGMHYTGMAAARFIGHPAAADPQSGSSTFLALVITMITVVFTMVVLGANGLLRYRQLFRDLSRSEAWMRALLTTTVDGVITINRNGIIVEFNASAERIYGWKRDEIIGQSIRLLMCNEELSERAGLLRVLATGEIGATAGAADVAGRHKDGSIVPLRRAIGHAQLDGEELFVCFITDISERRAMEQALRASEQQFRSLIGNIPGISYRSLVEGEQPMVFISDAVERVTGYPCADFLGAAPKRNFGTLIHAADRVRVSETIAQALRDERPYLVEYRLLHADGSTRWLWENGTGVRNDAGQLEWLDGVIVDITERREMEEALRDAKEKAEQAAAARASFVANMSHEIRTPMNSILGFTDVLLDGELNTDQRRHLDTIRSAGRALLRLLNEILDTAKLEKGAVELEQNDYNLLSLIDELSSTLAANARAKGLHVDIQYDPALPTCLRGDELRVRQVLTNLLDNAIKFTERGSVTLRAELQGEQMHVTVSDTGIGIAPERLAAIFEPFTQADASMTRRFGGTGLGTTICKQLVELMGGSIWAESTPGQGTTFHVLLPLMLARFAPQQPRVRTAAALPPLNVLVADDVPQNLELLQLLMARRGHTMTAVGDGAAVVDLAAREHYDVILMDFQMPTIDGLSATRLIRQQEEATGRTRVPIIAMTASVLDEHRRASVAAGMDGFATKPVDWFTLSHEIARVLGLGPGQLAAELPAQERQLWNRHAGLRRWSGREDAYREALALFEVQHAGLAATLAAQATAADYRALRMLAHKVRGVAANLGLEQLAGSLGAVEGLVDGDSGRLFPGAEDTLRDTLAALAPLLSGTLAAIRAAQPASVQTAQAPLQAPPRRPGVDLARAREAGETLRTALRRGALDDAALAALAAALTGHALASRVAQVHAALSDFDFELALQQLDAALGAIDDMTQEILS
ncbi:MHYT domain-containing protein [Massilia sp. YIM B02763]|uniref:MHYT domain-containing protein n=1 Tax=Massilia sp. YIM B02763 TaxID=3050130 RepID=UPI0025B6D377|nr:MHYT domain-containing protein [Massilia sp. YIM B02763]MDN4055289.1 MHYT domain-containing protein [Massilia sp. YIM B02763]